MSEFYTDNGPVFDYYHMDEFVDMVKSLDIKTVYKNKGIKNSYRILNIPCSFDIETTSYKDGDQKLGVMYIWMFGINGISIYGRYWADFIALIDELVIALDINKTNRLVCYVHNLGYEFQFMRKYFEWDEVFSLKERTPLYCVTDSGIEFRCSYMLSGTKLEKVGADLLKYKCKKMTGDLDYSKIRGPKTTMSEEELKYCINDVRVVMCYIMECIESEKNGLASIPLTKTGYVRRDVKKSVLSNKTDKTRVQNLTLSRPEYEMLKKAFQGGFTHANLLHSGQVVEDTVSYDFTSSYPTCLLLPIYPVSNGKKVNPKTYEEFMAYLQNKACVFNITIYNIELKDNMGDCPISSSKCVFDPNCKKVIDNGRIRSCEGSFTTTITNIDFLVYRKFYKFDYEIGEMIVYDKGYLPESIIRKVLEYYVNKTTLKDVEGKEADYNSSKANLNSIYGMMVMDIVRSLCEYDNTFYWSSTNSEEFTTDEIDEIIEKYNTNKNRFTWYPWGVFCTAMARYNLFTGIYECGNDYVYSDTDSIKILNCTDHEDYIINYNTEIIGKLQACCDHFGISYDNLSPKTIKGEQKPLGVWDFDGYYRKFKTLGAKRYMMAIDPSKNDDGTYKNPKSITPDGYELKITVAGLNKKIGAQHFAKYKDPFIAFSDDHFVPASETGKSTHTYIDDEYNVQLTDYQGNTELLNVKSGIYLESASFTLSLSPVYELLLQEIGAFDSGTYVN